MYYTEITESAKVGTKKFVNGLTYVKQVNGRWLIEPNVHVKRWLTMLYVRRELTLRELPAETGIPHSSLQTLLNHFGLMRSKKEKAKSHIDIVQREAEQIRSWNFDLVPAGRIAKRLASKYSVDMCVWAFHKACARAGIRVYKKTELRTLFFDKNFEKIRRQYEEGRSASSLAKALADKKPGLAINARVLMTYLRSKKVRVRNQQEANLLIKDKFLAAGRTSKAVLNNSSNRQSWHSKLNTDVTHLTYTEYKTLVATATNSARKRFKEEYADVRDRLEGYSIDHKFSIHDGYFVLDKVTLHYKKRKKPVPVHLMAHPANLQMIPDRTNRMKGSSSWQTLSELKEAVRRSDFKLK